MDHSPHCHCVGGGKPRALHVEDGVGQRHRKWVLEDDLDFSLLSDNGWSQQLRKREPHYFGGRQLSKEEAMNAPLICIKTKTNAMRAVVQIWGGVGH